MKVPYRQVHLDFHTAGDIAEVGSDFKKEEFIETLKKSHVNGINVFAKCHHGYCYYPTVVGTQHPNCTRDLLGEMLEVLTRENISTNIYIPIGWEEIAAQNESWLEISPEGVLGGKKPFEIGYYTWKKLCINNQEYMEYIKAQIVEIYEMYNKYNFNGYWFDIVRQEECLCSTCRMEMEEQGLNPQSSSDRKKHDHYVQGRFQQEITEFINELIPGKAIFYNGYWTPDCADDEEFAIGNRVQYLTHMEIENLPSELWGYDIFPYYMNYYNKREIDCVGMNGKFHTAWGDFGSIRNLEAAEYESFRMLMHGAKCCIGDQLHPRGKMDEATYHLIGQLYAQIEEREEWVIDDKKYSEVGVLLEHKPFQEKTTADYGVMNMLIELHYQFDFIDWMDEFDTYQVIILPDYVYMSHKHYSKVQKYLKNGGKIIASHKSGYCVEKKEYIFEEAGIDYLGDSEFTPMYIKLGEQFSKEQRMTEQALYPTGSKVLAKESSSVWAQLGKPYFNRDINHFCSHRHYPFEKLVEDAGIVKNDNVIYISHPIFTDYQINGLRLYRTMFQKSMETLLENPVVKSNLPTSAEITVREQEERILIHIIHYIPERRCEKFDIVDTKIPLYHIEIECKVSKIPMKVYLAPNKENLEYRLIGDYLYIEIPKIEGHGIVVIEY